MQRDLVLGAPLGGGEQVNPVVPAGRQRQELAPAPQVVTARARLGEDERDPADVDPRSGLRQVLGREGIAPDVEAARLRIAGRRDGAIIVMRCEADRMKYDSRRGGKYGVAFPRRESSAHVTPVGDFYSGPAPRAGALPNV